jgi:hypothetical protein
VPSRSVRLELPANTLARLISGGALCAADFRCLDCASKHCVRRLLMHVCAGAMPAAKRCAEAFPTVDSRAEEQGPRPLCAGLRAESVDCPP